MSADEPAKTVTVEQPTYRCRQVRLEVVDGPDTGREHRFYSTARVGAKSLADLVLHDRRVSGLHCELFVGDRVRVRDLGSKNGTFVGGVRVYDAEIPSGERLVIGDSSIRVIPELDAVEVPLHPATDFHGIIGRSASIRALMAKTERLASEESTVLIEGESGSGKECFAAALHYAGGRAKKPLVVVDCGALPRGLIEAELMGHERGAFTGADSTVVGAFERARGGTIFLDEIGELPLDMQPKLLRVLESRQVQRIGGTRAIAVDVRIVAASNRSLALEVARGRFREDLYYRLAVVCLRLPPLRERLDDIPPLAVHFLRELGVDPASALTAESLAHLQSHDWPGNVRELRNTLLRATSLNQPPTFDESERLAPANRNVVTFDFSVPLRTGKQMLVDRYERAYLQDLLRRCNGNISEVGRRAGVDRISVHRALQRLKIDH